MRITNKMMSNNSLININGNKEYLDRLNTQMATEKKITRPSDDPIVAIRALRLRSDLSQVTQYYGANVPDAQSWVSVTQKAIDSTMDMLSSMRALCNQGANGTNTTSEREKIYETLKGYKSQVYLNGNTSTAGRTVFTGYRTGEKLTFTEDVEADYRGIADTFNAKDVVKNTYVESQVSADNINDLTVGDTIGKVDAVGIIEIGGKTLYADKNDSGKYASGTTISDGVNTYNVSEDGDVTFIYNTTLTDPKVEKYTEVNILGKTYYLKETNTTPVKYEDLTVDGTKYTIDDDGNVRVTYGNTEVLPTPPAVSLVRNVDKIKIDGLVKEIEGTPGTERTFTVNGKNYKADASGHVIREYVPKENIGNLEVKYDEQSGQIKVGQIEIGGSLYPEPDKFKWDSVTGFTPTNPADSPTFIVGDTTYEVGNDGVVYKKYTDIGDVTNVDIATIDEKDYTLEKDGSGNFKDIADNDVVYGFKPDPTDPTKIQVIKKYSSTVYGSVVKANGNPVEVEGVKIDEEIHLVKKDAGGNYGNITVNNVVYTIATDGTVKKAYEEIGKLADGGKITIGGASGSVYTTKKDINGHYDNINAAGKTYIVSDNGDVTEIKNGEIEVKEDKVNRIRLSYDNISGSVRKGVTEGFAHAESGNSTYYSYAGYYNDDGSLKPGASQASFFMSGSDSDESAKTHLNFHDPYDQTLVPVKESEYVKGILTDEPRALVDGNTIKVKYGDPQLTITLTKDASGNYSADKGASVSKEGDNLTITVPGPNGTKDLYTEIKLTKDDTGFTVKSQKMWRLSEANFIPAGDKYGGNVLTETLIYTTTASDTTTLVYRTALSQKASIPQNQVVTDAVKGLQSFDLVYGGKTYTIKKLEDEDRWFAYDGSTIQKNIQVVQNTDKSFSIYAAANGVEVNHQDKDCDVFNVSANGRTVTSYYHQTALKVQITDSTSAVAVKDGKELTAYQYLALNDQDVNTDTTAASKIYLLADTGELVFGSDIAKTLSTLQDIDGVDTISVKYDKNQFESGDLRPEHYFDCVELTNKDTIVDPTTYDNHNQEISYTVGQNQNIRINTNAEDVFDTQIVRELDDILSTIDDYNQAEEKVNKLKAMQQDTVTYNEDAQKKITVLLDAANKELEIAKNRLQKRYETGITAFKNFYEQANLANTNCGTIDSRLTLISNRLMEQKATVTTLASENENVDITNIAVEVKEAELVYNAALMATGKISQHSLVDYI